MARYFPKRNENWRRQKTSTQIVLASPFTIISGVLVKLVPWGGGVPISQFPWCKYSGHGWFQATNLGHRTWSGEQVCAISSPKPAWASCSTLLIFSSKWETTEMFINRRVGKQIVVHSVWQNAILKFKGVNYECMPTTWVNFKDIMLHQRSQTQESTYCTVPFLWNTKTRGQKDDHWLSESPRGAGVESDCDGGYLGEYICQNLSNCILYMGAVYCMSIIPQPSSF